jgi:hypothetical protein
LVDFGWDAQCAGDSAQVKAIQAQPFASRGLRQRVACLPHSANAIAPVRHLFVLPRSLPGARRTAPGPNRFARPHCQCTVCRASPTCHPGQAVLRRKKIVRHRVACRTGRRRPDPLRSPGWTPYPSNLQHPQRSWTAYIACQTFM